MKRSCISFVLVLIAQVTGVNTSFALGIGIDTTAFVTNPILSCPTDSSITISVVPKKILQLYYEYGTAPLAFTNQSAVVTSAANVPVRTDLQTLSPNTRYYYRIRYTTSGALSYTIGDQCTFMTRRSRGSRFAFTLTGDSHLYDKKGIPATMKVTMQNIANDAPDFDMEMGDTFGDDHTPLTTTQSDMYQLHLDYMPYIGMICHSAPFFLTIGNHEGESGYYLLQTPPKNIAVYGTLARKYYYPLPSPNGFYSGDTTSEGYGMGRPENYYAWEWGDALFVVLDVYRYPVASDSPGQWDWTLGMQQYSWLKETLEKSTAKYKFVFAHHTRGYGRGGAATAKYFEWGGYENNGTTWGFSTNRPGWALPVHQLMVKNHVNVFFQGHDHLFAVEKLDGLVYQECPMPSDSTYMIGYLANADAYTGVVLNGTGHIRVTVTPDSATVDYVSAYMPRDTNATHRNAAIAYSYSIKPNVTAVANEQPLPLDFRLEQNYPNPFNPGTVISYQLPISGIVSLVVFDVLGKEVATLIDGFQELGYHRIQFSASDHQLAAGVYFYTIRLNGWQLTKIMMLIK